MCHIINYKLGKIFEDKNTFTFLKHNALRLGYQWSCTVFTLPLKYHLMEWNDFNLVLKKEKKKFLKQLITELKKKTI